jgi:precorrin-2/cobalt-factor-2 C20-methyltransferase
MIDPPPSPTGRLIGVSLGPGDPELITRRAWAALTSGARWTYPVKGRTAASFALDIAARAGLEIPDDAEPLHFPMTGDREILGLAWERAGARCAELLAEGPDVLFLVEGDASTYSTFGHLARAVRARVPGVAVEIVPGVPSYTAAAARLGVPLAEEGETLAVVPAAYGIETIDRLIDAFDTLVLLKVNPLLDAILELLERRGLIGEARFVERAGTPEERVVEQVETLTGERVPYLSLLLVRNPGRVRGPLHRGCAKIADPMGRSGSD